MLFNKLFHIPGLGQGFVIALFIKIGSASLMAPAILRNGIVM